LGNKSKESAIKPKAYAWLDANASTLSRNQLYDGLVSEFGVTLSTAKVYASGWRKSNGVQRTYKPRKEIGGE
jgi:hypothetical protein